MEVQQTTKELNTFRVLPLCAAIPSIIAYASDHSLEYMKKRAVGFIY
jgi:hypothetical protein